MSDLLDAVNALTLTTTTKVPQGDVLVTIVHEPLLDQLEAAITSAIGSGGGGGSATGLMLNSAALYQATLINSQIRSWCSTLGVVANRDAGSNLRAWYVAFLPTSRDDRVFVDKLHDWSRQITGLLDPPKRIPLKGACPVCKTAQVADDEGALSAPLEVRYDQAAPNATLKAVCRADGCEAVWPGGEAVAELVEELKESDPPAA